MILDMGEILDPLGPDAWNTEVPTDFTRCCSRKEMHTESHRHMSLVQPQMQAIFRAPILRIYRHSCSCSAVPKRKRETGGVHIPLRRYLPPCCKLPLRLRYKWTACCTASCSHCLPGWCPFSQGTISRVLCQAVSCPNPEFGLMTAATAQPRGKWGSLTAYDNTQCPSTGCCEIKNQADHTPHSFLPLLPTWHRPKPLHSHFHRWHHFESLQTFFGDLVAAVTVGILVLKQMLDPLLCSGEGL